MPSTRIFVLTISTLWYGRGGDPEKNNMTDAILISANLSMVDIDDAVHHLESHDELYWSVMFRIHSEQFSFPIYAFIHISGKQVEYRALVDRIIPFSRVFESPLAERVKPLSFRQLWESDPRERARPWRNDLVFTEIVPFSFDTKHFEKLTGGRVTLAPRGYVRVIPPNHPVDSASPQPAPPPQLARSPHPSIAETNLEDFVIQRLDKIEAGLRLPPAVRRRPAPSGRPAGRGGAHAAGTRKKGQSKWRNSDTLVPASANGRFSRPPARTQSTDSLTRINVVRRRRRYFRPRNRRA
jgi:hypothetical protein